MRIPPSVCVGDPFPVLLRQFSTSWQFWTGSEPRGPVLIEF
ncbi:hypothetical protein D3OALGA1CA_5441 [Olavius algarvensis associated proteobacterium Delta 3]|nr:hypothetical protein D3OALGA1CA_5441 [Olavius algarvensis associated proteobacterium Delta 3]